VKFSCSTRASLRWGAYGASVSTDAADIGAAGGGGEAAGMSNGEFEMCDAGAKFFTPQQSFPLKNCRPVPINTLYVVTGPPAKAGESEHKLKWA